MVFIDDATSRITAAQFAPTENSLSYRELIEQHVWRYGIPLAFYSDRHSIFTPVDDYRILARSYQLTDYERVCRHHRNHLRSNSSGQGANRAFK